ncbi:MAG: hypothetical protein BZ136_07745 [Methanosphaera sp. rholeuAM74]|nr:MAG: hypothetical protein BZ136_07745 [Methanosphaera sp. rholeuAM74]
MDDYFSSLIFESDFFDVELRDNAVVVYLKSSNNVLSSSWLNGGYFEDATSIINQSLTTDDYSFVEHNGSEAFQKKRMSELGLDSSNSMGLLTSASMDNVSISTKEYKNLSVTSIVTAGADKNGVKAGDTASFYEENNKYYPNTGTINIITLIDANLDAGGLVTASITLTEAKTSVLSDLKVESQYSNFIATGTGTDGLSVVSNKDSDNHLENAGKHSKLGELIASSVREALFDALYLQTFMSYEYQSTVLSRMSRFNVFFDDFFEKSGFTSKVDYASMFYEVNKDNSTVSVVSSILNLVDEVNVGLLELNDVAGTIVYLLDRICPSNEKKGLSSVDDVIGLIVSTLNNKIKEGELI